MAIQVSYSDSMPEDVYVVYRTDPPQLVVNEAWWRNAPPVERIRVLDSLWTRLEAIPDEPLETPGFA